MTMENYIGLILIIVLTVLIRFCQKGLPILIVATVIYQAIKRLIVHGIIKSREVEDYKRPYIRKNY